MTFRLTITHSGGPSLETVAAALRGMDNRRILSVYRRQLRPHMTALQREIRASISAIPSKGLPEREPERLRVRLARCVRVTSDVTGNEAVVAVFMDVKRMPSGQYALPAYQEGIKPNWRHPVFGHSAKWVGQRPFPYFFPVIAARLGTEQIALDRASEQVKKAVLG